jgi:tRNA G18 (ribose-2'-O)-methylase SpoU
MEVIGIDNVPGSQPIETAVLPARCVLLFGQEGPGLSEAAIAGCSRILDIQQYGSTRSMNASAAGAIAMFAWAQQNLRH